MTTRTTSRRRPAPTSTDDLRTELAHLLTQRANLLRRAAKVTTGNLHTAITHELTRTTRHQQQLPHMNRPDLTHYLKHHTRAQQAWTTHGADHLLPEEQRPGPC